MITKKNEIFFSKTFINLNLFDACMVLVCDKEKLAECVGLWLAEGDRKTLYEITFTNNYWDLIKFLSRNPHHLWLGMNA